MAQTLTGQDLGLPAELVRALGTTNLIENGFSQTGPPGARRRRRRPARAGRLGCGGHRRAVPTISANDGPPERFTAA